MTKMKPEEIGAALIALSGQDGQLEEENRQRNEVLKQRDELAQAERKAREEQAEEDAELVGIDARDRARRLIDEAGTKWKRYAARQYLAVLDLERKAASEIGERETILADRKKETAEATAGLDRLRNSGDLPQREDEARNKLNAANEIVRGLNSQRTVIDTKKAGLITERNDLQPRSARWNGRSPEAAVADLQEAVTSHVRAVSALESADKAAQAAAADLDDAQAGRSGNAGHLVKRLRSEAGIPEAVALADVIELDEGVRAEWEPRLFPLLNAVVVPQARAAQALQLLASEPGAQVVITDGPDVTGQHLTRGGVRYPAGLQQLMDALARRLTLRQDPIRADDGALGISVLGGFPDPVVGREALIRHAERTLGAAQEEQRRAVASLRTAEARHDIAEAQDMAAKAVWRLREIEEQLAGFDRDITELVGRTAAAEQAQETAREAHERANALLTSHDAQVALASLQLEGAKEREAEASKKLEQARADREGLPVEAWSREFGSTVEDATRLWADSPDGPATRPQSLLRQAAGGRAASGCPECLSEGRRQRARGPDDRGERARRVRRATAR